MKKIKYTLFLVLCLLITNYKVDATTGICADKKLNSSGYCTIDPISISRTAIPDIYKPMVFTDGDYPLNYSYSGSISGKSQTMFCLDGNYPQPGSQTYGFAKPFNVSSNDYERAIGAVYNIYMDEVVKEMNKGTSKNTAYEKYLQMINVTMRFVTVKYGYNLKGGAPGYYENHLIAYKNIIKQLEGGKPSGRKLVETKPYYDTVKKWYCSALLSCKKCAKISSSTLEYCKSVPGAKKITPKEFKVEITSKNEGITTDYVGSKFIKKVPFTIKGLSNFKIPGYDITNPSFKIKSVKCDNVVCELEPPTQLNSNILSRVTGDEYEFKLVLKGDKADFLNISKTKVDIEYEKSHILDSDNLAILRYTMGVHELQRMIVLMPERPTIQKLSLKIDLPSMCETKIVGGVAEYKFGGTPKGELQYMQSGCCNLDPNYLTNPTAIEYYLNNCSTEDVVVLVNVCRNDGSGEKTKSYVYQKPIGEIMSNVNDAEESYDKGKYRTLAELNTVLNKYKNNWDDIYTKNGISPQNDYCKMYTSEKQDILYPGTVESKSGQFFIFDQFQQPSVQGEIYANYHTDVKRWLRDYKAAIEKEKNDYEKWQEAAALEDAVDQLGSCFNTRNACGCSCCWNGPKDEDGNATCGNKTCGCDEMYEVRDLSYAITKGDYYNIEGEKISKSASLSCGCGGEKYRTSKPYPRAATREETYLISKKQRKNLEKYKEECENKTNIARDWKYELSPDLDFYYKQKINSLSGGSEEIIEEIPMQISYASDGKYWINISDRNPILISGSQRGAYSSKSHSFKYGGGGTGDEKTLYYDNTLDYQIGYEQTLYYKPSTYYYSLVPSGKYVTEVYSGMSAIDIGYVYNIELTNFEDQYETWFEIRNIGHLMRNTSIKPKLRSNIQYSVDLYLEDNKANYPDHNNDADGKIFTNKCYYDNKQILYKNDCLDCEDPNFVAQFFYRPIAINNLNPNNRTNTNWTTTKGITAKNNIELTGINIYDDTKKYLEYSFTLSPVDMKEIKNYNKSNDYSDFNLQCKNGKECESAFLEDWATKSNTTNLLNDTRNNKWKYFVNGVWERGNISNLFTGGIYPSETENYSEWP